MSSDLSDVRLWSNYADGHKGIAIEIDFPDDESHLYKLNYVDGLQEYMPTVITDPVPSHVLSFKTKHWAHESEYRLIIYEDYFSIKDRITAIYAGVRVSESQLSLLRKIIPNNINLFTSKMHEELIRVEPDDGEPVKDGF